MLQHEHDKPTAQKPYYFVLFKCAAVCRTSFSLKRTTGHLHSGGSFCADGDTSCGGLLRVSQSRPTLVLTILWCSPGHLPGTWPTRHRTRSQVKCTSCRLMPQHLRQPGTLCRLGHCRQGMFRLPQQVTAAQMQSMCIMMLCFSFVAA